jgi:hypothetical protein
MSFHHLDPNELIYEVQDFQRSSPENLVCADCKTPGKYIYNLFNYDNNFVRPQVGKL